MSESPPRKRAAMDPPGDITPSPLPILEVPATSGGGNNGKEPGAVVQITASTPATPEVLEV